MKNTVIHLVALACSIAACDASEGPVEAERAAVESVAAVTDPASGRAPAASVASASAEPRDAAAPRGPAMPGAKQAFTTVADLVATQYVDGPLSEDELWTGAMQGVLARAAQGGDPHVNALLSPAELQELLIGTKGLLVGVGIKIERVAGVVVVADVIPGGPAEAARIAAGDRILGIDGERIGPLELADVVARIRGVDGSKVALFLQRDTEEWTAEVIRGQIHVDSVEATSLGDGVGYLRITSFAEGTPGELGDELTSLRRGGATRIVLDLRDCPGGMLDATVGIAEHFLPVGAPVLSITHRDGTTESRVTERDRGGGDLPLAVLIGPGTASSAEILADALHHAGDRADRRAILVGDTTFGKRTIESIHELAEGWAVKLSVSRFVLASGATGAVKPDVRIPADPERKPARIGAVQADDDPTLAAAMELLDRR
ncbi:MAG: PDZ domain-containing protein [Myxococcales bacterium]|nr:PDZ domain-containing protein [Myxococcales bacterium]